MDRLDWLAMTDESRAAPRRSCSRPSSTSTRACSRRGPAEPGAPGRMDQVLLRRNLDHARITSRKLSLQLSNTSTCTRRRQNELRRPVEIPAHGRLMNGDGAPPPTDASARRAVPRHTADCGYLGPEWVVVDFSARRRLNRPLDDDAGIALSSQRLGEASWAVSNRSPDSWGCPRR
jgi:hypothetical protein